MQKCAKWLSLVGVVEGVHGVERIQISRKNPIDGSAQFRGTKVHEVVGCVMIGIGNDIRALEIQPRGL